MPRSSSLTTSALVAIIIAGLSFLLLLALLYAFCRCRRTHAAKKQSAASTASPASTGTAAAAAAAGSAGKDYEADAAGTAADGGGAGVGIETQSLSLPPPPPPYYPTGSLDSKHLDGGMELTRTALHDPDEQLNMQQGEMHSQQQQQQQTQHQHQHQQHAGYGKQTTGGLYGINPPSHANGYGYHVTSAIGVDGDSYQVLPSSAGHHGECK